MGLFRNLRKSGGSALAALLVVAGTPARASVEVPVGTELQLRLKTKLASNASKPKDAVEAQLIAPVVVDGEFLIPAAATVRGTLAAVTPYSKPDGRAMLDVRFTELEIEGKKVKLPAQVFSVDNARESVTPDGLIQGIVASETLSARMDAGINKLAQRYGGLAGVLGAAKGSMVKESDGDIAYDPGVELTLKLTAPLRLDKPLGPGPAGNLDGLDDPVAALVTAQPFQTVAQSPPKPSDVTNVMIIGTQAQMDAAFKAAGWSTAAVLNAESKLETFRAIAEQRGYKEAPVSVLLLDNRPPDQVYQKQNNTFAQRHHLRVWQRPDSYRGQPVWVVAATHDVGIDFSEKNHTFIHKIDPAIDRERSKVVNDLVSTGLVAGLALVDRPAVPKKSQNATGDALVTDGHMAVLLLK